MAVPGGVRINAETRYPQNLQCKESECEKGGKNYLAVVLKVPEVLDSFKFSCCCILIEPERLCHQYMTTMTALEMTGHP